MKTSAAALTLFSTLVSTVTSRALFSRDQPPCNSCSGFTITASGGVSGVLGQLTDGQNRVYGNFPTGKYSIGCDGGITDANGRGCILTPPTTQFQCDAGAKPTTGFSIGPNGQLSVQGSSTFWAFPTGEKESYNVYTMSIQAKCVQITLTANGCSKPATPPPPPPPTTQPTTPPITPAKTCPTTLNPGFEFPHLIIPVDSSKPSTAFGTQYFGQVTSTVSSIFNFDIPAGDNGKTCSLVFLFPMQKDLQTSSFTFTGNGNISFQKLVTASTQGTTYANQPAVQQDYGVTKVAPGNSYTVATFPCPGNSAIAFKMTSTDGTCLNYFQDYNPSPIGLYITKC